MSDQSATDEAFEPGAEPQDDAGSRVNGSEGATTAAESTEPNESRGPKAKATPKAKPEATKTKRTGSRGGKRAAKKRARERAASASSAPYPRHTVERALRIPKALYDQNGGRPATPQEAVEFSGGSSLTGPWRVEISSAKKYGFLESIDDGQLALTNRARQAIAPQSPSDRVGALRDAILAAPDVSDVYNYYRGENLPDQQFFVNALSDRFDIPPDKIGEFLEIFDDSIRSAELIDESGTRPRLIDVGRDEQHQRSTPDGRGSRKPAPAGTTCFVMQPFEAPLGDYYESIYKPAIEQAGLQPLRADAEIFGTGKIMDQIWRGIQSSKVLVAELTTKNANVFYELGLAHALEKPVVLVSSNQDDVPFDLHHIRVILYDQTDPFWGQKLIDKLADTIRSALDDPEQAIFRVDTVR